MRGKIVIKSGTIEFWLTQSSTCKLIEQKKRIQCNYIFSRLNIKFLLVFLITEKEKKKSISQMWRTISMYYFKANFLESIICKSWKLELSITQTLIKDPPLRRLASFGILGRKIKRTRIRLARGFWYWIFSFKIPCAGFFEPSWKGDCFLVYLVRVPNFFHHLIVIQW